MSSEQHDHTFEQELADAEWIVTPLDGSPPYAEPLGAPLSPEEFMRGGDDGC